MSSTIAAMRKRIERLERTLGVVRNNQDTQPCIHLPLKDNEPPVSYQRGKILFFVPKNRQSEDIPS